jgi:transcriptional regulator with XRE-family HTH domain
MLTSVRSPANLLREARCAAQLSVRALASRAGVPASTISRIERGQVDPTVGMLGRLLAAADLDLEIVTRPLPEAQLASLADAWEPSARGDLVDWTRLRAFLDHLELYPDETASAVRRMPAPSGSALLDTLLAGIAETLCDQLGVQRPPWTARVPALSTPWVTPGTPRIQEQARATTPPALAARGVVLARNSLWRDHSLAAHT